MYTYLGPRSNPPLRFVFQRSLKLLLVLLTPPAVAFAALAGPICRLIYGNSFNAAAPLRVLAPGVVLMGVITLSVSLLVSRENPRRMVFLTAVMAGLNIILNLILIPEYGDVGAAAAMLATEVVYVAWIVHRANRAVGGIRLSATLAGALTAGLGMTVTSLLLHGNLLAALLAGGAIYLIVLFAVERLINPLDVAFAVDLARRRLPARLVGPFSPS
jgi:O-antigen/teichoic acid export membrane protein